MFSFRSAQVKSQPTTNFIASGCSSRRADVDTPDGHAQRERHELRRQVSNTVDERRDQFLIGSFADVRCARRINDPVIAIVVRD
jgi:hypothetical protein